MTTRKEVKLLVVDDHADHFEHLKEYAEMYNSLFRVDICRVSSNKAAGKKVATWQPSVILFDVHMPDGNSLESIKDISSSGVPIVAMSATQSREIEESALSKGAVSYITKSNSPEDLEVLLEHLASLSLSPSVEQ